MRTQELVHQKNGLTATLLTGEKQDHIRPKQANIQKPQPKKKDIGDVEKMNRGRSIFYQKGFGSVYGEEKMESEWSNYKDVILEFENELNPQPPKIDDGNDHVITDDSQINELMLIINELEESYYDEDSLGARLIDNQFKTVLTKSSSLVGNNSFETIHNLKTMNQYRHGLQYVSNVKNDINGIQEKAKVWKEGYRSEKRKILILLGHELNFDKPLDKQGTIELENALKVIARDPQKKEILEKSIKELELISSNLKGVSPSIRGADVEFSNSGKLLQQSIKPYRGLKEIDEESTAFAASAKGFWSKEIIDESNDASAFSFLVGDQSSLKDRVSLFQTYETSPEKTSMVKANRAMAKKWVNRDYKFKNWGSKLATLSSDLEKDFNNIAINSASGSANRSLRKVSLHALEGLKQWADANVITIAELKKLSEKDYSDENAITGDLKKVKSTWVDNQAKMWANQVIDIIEGLYKTYEMKIESLRGDMTVVNKAVASKMSRDKVSSLYSSLKVIEKLSSFKSELSYRIIQVGKIDSALNYQQEIVNETSAMDTAAWGSLFQGVANTASDAINTGVASTGYRKEAETKKHHVVTIGTDKEELQETTDFEYSAINFPVDGIVNGLTNIAMNKYLKEKQRIRATHNVADKTLLSLLSTSDKLLNDATTAQANIEGKWETFLPNVDTNELFKLSTEHGMEYLRGAIDARALQANEGGLTYSDALDRTLMEKKINAISKNGASIVLA